MLTVTDLSLARGGLPLVSGLSFSVQAGEAVILRGPNGSGKTTVLRCLAGLQSATEGRVEMPEDAAVYGGHAEANKAVMTVAENLEFWGAVYGRGVDPAIYDQFDLKGLERRLAGRLSAGQKRRLALARMAVSGRPLMLLDEPTTSLDAASVERFGTWIASHLAGGGAAVIVAHGPIPVEGREIDLSDYRAALQAELDW